MATTIPDHDAKRIAAGVLAKWPEDEFFDARLVLDSHPELRGHRTVLFDFVIEEFNQRLDRGEDVAPSTFADRFSTYRKSLAKVLEANVYLRDHDLLPNLDGQIEGQTLMGFRCVRELGRGSFSRVFLARQETLGERYVVVKFFSGGREPQALGELSHKHIVDVHSVDHDPGGMSALCMPFISQATLLDVLDEVVAKDRFPRLASVTLDASRRANADVTECELENGSPPVVLQKGTYDEGIAEIGRQLADALVAVHHSGLRHGDIKPSNVLWSSEGTARLFDFNLAARADDLVFGGTLAYMAPEQLSVLALPETEESKEERKRLAAKVDQQADLFAFGAMMYELLCGELPFLLEPKQEERRETACRLLEQQRSGVTPLRQKNPRVGRRLARLVESCLAFEAEDRVSSAEEIRDALTTYLSPRPRTVRWAQRCWPLVMTAVVLLIGLGWLGIAGMKERRIASFLREANRSFDSGEYAKSLDQYLAVEDLDPDNVRAVIGQGKSLLRLQNQDGAKEAFRRALAMAPSSKMATWLGTELCLERFPNEAEEFFQLALDSGRADITTLNNYGYALAHIGKLEKANDVLRQATKVNPNVKEVWFNRVYLNARIAARTKQPVDPSAADRAITLSDCAKSHLDRAIAFAISYRNCEFPQLKPVLMQEVFASCKKALDRRLRPDRLTQVGSFSQDFVRDPRFQALLRANPPEEPARDPSVVLVAEFPAQ